MILYVYSEIYSCPLSFPILQLFLYPVTTLVFFPLANYCTKSASPISSSGLNRFVCSSCLEIQLACSTNSLTPVKIIAPCVWCASESD